MTTLNWLADSDFDGIEVPKIRKVNRIRYQQVKEVLKLKQRYEHRNNSQIGDDFGLSSKTVSRIKNSRSYNKYKRSRNNVKADSL